MESQIDIRMSICGLVLSGVTRKTHDIGLPFDPVLPAAKAGALTTRTDNDTGTCTLGAGHGITTGATVDVFWAGGSRRGMTVGTVSGTSVPIDSGTGDNLPAADTAITMTTRTTIDIDADFDAGVVIGIQPNRRSYVSFRDSGDAELFGKDLAAGEVFQWHDTCGLTRPITGNAIAYALLSNADSAGSCTFKGGIGYS